MDLGLLVTAFLLGLRHGVDWDHLAAIADISGSQAEPRRSIVLSMLYAAGHGVMVLALGTAAIAAGDYISDSLDAAMGKIVGLTLVLLGIYVLYSLIRHGRRFRMRSRWMLVIEAARRGIARARRRHTQKFEIEHEHDHDHEHDHEHDHLGHDDPATRPARVAVDIKTHRHRHRHVVTMPADPFTRYGKRSSFFVGMLHGVGAETPTQVVIFVAAAGTGGVTAGMVLLVTFLLGLFVSNTAVAVASSFGFLQAARNFIVYAAIAVVTAAVSLTLGTLYLLD